MANPTNENRNAAFLESLYEEKLRHKDHRHTFVVQKLLFIIGLFGLGVLEIKGGGEHNILFNNGFLLYLVPFVALAYDVYIFAEDFKVKRVGLFVRTRAKMTGVDEMAWEKWVSSHREGMAERASKALTWIAFITSIILIFLLRSTDPFNWGNSVFYFIWLILSLGFILRAEVLYGESNRILKQALLRKPVILDRKAESELNLLQKGVSDNLKNELHKKLMRVPENGYVKVSKRMQGEPCQWEIYELRKRWWIGWWLIFVHRKRKLYIVKKDDKERLVIQQID
jgi:hypothetical protein